MTAWLRFPRVHVCNVQQYDIGIIEILESELCECGFGLRVTVDSVILELFERGFGLFVTEYLVILI
jgi:hypothetical protein